MKCITFSTTLFSGTVFHYHHFHLEGCEELSNAGLEIHSWDLFSGILASHNQTNAHTSVMLVILKQLH